MNTLEFAALVDRVEHESAAHPKRYRATVLGLAALGFLVMGSALLLAIFVALAATFIVIKSPAWIGVLLKVILIPIAMIWGLGKALLTRTPPPEGQRLTAREAPALFAAIERVRVATGAPAMDEVLITPEFNAFAAEIPRFGPFLPKRCLGLGLPLLMGMPAAEVSAVIAHEFGHFSSRHGRVGGFIYRVRAMWMAMLQAADYGILNRFVQWYAPYFNAYSFVMARQHEFVADRAAADHCGTRVTAQALCRSAVSGQALASGFWPGIGERVPRESTPPAALFSEMAAFLPKAGDPEALKRALAVVTGHDDTHPSLTDRLAALGAPASTPPFTRSAAADWLGPLATTLAEAFSRNWLAQNAEAWQQAHVQARADAARAAELAARNDLSQDESFEKLSLHLAEVPRKDEQVALLRDFLQHHQHAQAAFQLGTLVLDTDDAEARTWFDRATAWDPDARIPVAQVLSNHYLQRGQRDRAAPFFQVLEQEASIAEKDAAERAGMPHLNRMQPPVVDARDEAELLRRLPGIPGIQAIWIVGVALTERPQVPHFLIVVQRRWWRLFTRDRKLVDQLANDLDLHATWIMLPATSLSTLQRFRVRRVGRRLVNQGRR